jgi:hypothetical protein
MGPVHLPPQPGQSEGFVAAFSLQLGPHGVLMDFAVAPVSGLILGEVMEVIPLFEDRFLVMAGTRQGEPVAAS